MSQKNKKMKRWSSAGTPSGCFRDVHEEQESGLRCRSPQTVVGLVLVFTRVLATVNVEKHKVEKASFCLESQNNRSAACRDSHEAGRVQLNKQREELIQSSCESRSRRRKY